MRLLVGAVVAAAILLTALSVAALRSPWSGAGQPAGDAPRGSVTLHGGTARHTVTLTVATPVTGATAVDVLLVRRAGQPSGSPVVSISAVLPAAGHAVPDYPAAGTADGRYHVDGLPLMMPGRWQIRVAVDGDLISFPITVPR